MIEESRSIVLSDNELVAALSPLFEDSDAKPDEMPASIDFSYDEAGDIRVELTFDSLEDPIVINQMEAGRAILHHCIAQRIPLPRGSQKELALRGDQLALIVRIVTGDD